MIKRQLNIALVGATGAVGLELLRVLEQRRFPVGELRLFASPRSAGRRLKFGYGRVKVEGLSAGVFKRIDIAFFTAGSAISKIWAPRAVKEGSAVIDNTSAFRLMPDVPLVVPEVNAHTMKYHTGIIANPNCSTIQLVVVLKPIHDAVRIKRVVVTTLQAVSGAGLKALYEMEEETRARLSHSRFKRTIFPHQIAFNAIPQIPQSDAFLANDYTVEEMKMINETQKIMGDKSIAVTATCVRVPVYRGHSESVNIQTAKPLTPVQARRLLMRAPGVKVIDRPKQSQYPTAAAAAGQDAVLVGRIRADNSAPKTLNLWVVSDNLRKGAALNAVQIAELLIK
jgi:aspartate-semialdehyde dehydrogenase